MSRPRGLSVAEEAKVAQEEAQGAAPSPGASRVPRLQRASTRHGHSCTQVILNCKELQ